MTQPLKDNIPLKQSAPSVTGEQTQRPGEGTSILDITPLSEPFSLIEHLRKGQLSTLKKKIDRIIASSSSSKGVSRNLFCRLY